MNILRYIKTNNIISAYALYIPNIRHEYGSSEHTMQLLKARGKGKFIELLGIILHAIATTTGLINR